MPITYIKAYTLLAKHIPVRYARGVSSLQKLVNRSGSGNLIKIYSVSSVTNSLSNTSDIYYISNTKFVISDNWKHVSFVTTHRWTNKSSDCEQWRTSRWNIIQTEERFLKRSFALIKIIFWTFCISTIFLLRHLYSKSFCIPHRLDSWVSTRSLASWKNAWCFYKSSVIDRQEIWEAYLLSVAMGWRIGKHIFNFAWIIPLLCHWSVSGLRISRVKFYFLITRYVVYFAESRGI